MAKWIPNYGQLTPDHHYLSDSAVLVQAWKKAHAHIRPHNWYADSLELDTSALQLRDLLKQWSAILRGGAYRRFKPDPMRLVPAPKSGMWDLQDGWRPSVEDDELKLRPLAHLSIRDQTLAMAFLLCLANIVETAQGDPDTRIANATKHHVVSYGHRLVSSWRDNQASFRWGNTKLYRQYFTDYQSFVRRPDRICEELFPQGNGWAIVQTDLSQFYDRIKRAVLIEKLQALAASAIGADNLDRRFFDVMHYVFSWSWHSDDHELVRQQFGVVEADGLPQGLAASGFFANVYLLDFDEAIVSDFDQRPSGHKWSIVDYCRYVDDMRFVLTVDASLSADDVKSQFQDYLQQRLSATAPGLKLNTGKTKIKLGDSQSSIARKADAMEAITNRVSGPFDVAAAKQALDLLDGLLSAARTEQTEFQPRGTGQDDMLARLFRVEPDVRPDTVERFVAHRWRRVYRSLRLMCDAEGFVDSALNMGRASLDRRAEAFSLELIRRWIDDPSNVRLLRVALDIFPRRETLEVVLSLLKAHLDHASDTNARKVCAYVAAELLRAGATETGFVRDADELPTGSEVEEYRQVLLTFAQERLSGTLPEPWYLVQQAMLYLAVMRVPAPAITTMHEANQAYIALHGLLQGHWPQGTDMSAMVSLLLVAHRLTGGTDTCASLFVERLRQASPSEVEHALFTILTEDDDLLDAIWVTLDDAEADFWRNHFAAIGYLPSVDTSPEWTPEDESQPNVSLLKVITSSHNPFRQETSSLRLLQALVHEWGTPSRRRENGGGVLTPSRIDVHCASWVRLADPTVPLAADDFSVHIRPIDGPHDVRYDVPEWCKPSEKWKVELGQVLRAAILGKPDYTQDYRIPYALEGIQKYRPTSGGWFKRKHGLYNERRGLGDQFLPISPWMSELLWTLLAWPGTKNPTELVNLPERFRYEELENVVVARLEELAESYCRLSGMPAYEFPVKLACQQFEAGKLKIAVVQSILPQWTDLRTFGPGLADPAFRRRHRRHLTGMLQLLLKVLEVREGYKERRECVDLVIFPELSVHPDDIPLVIRFADTAKCMVFCGTVFHSHPCGGDALINSGIWILPVCTADGRAIYVIEQGKGNPTPAEVSWGIVRYRPCQWVIAGCRGNEPPWRLSAAICYDATDLRLAADLRNLSDGFIVSASNKDINTFDSMVAALHYHMYQHVILVNTGEFGGTTVQAPYKAHHRKLIVHHHGMDAALVSVFEVDLLHFRGLPPPAANDPPDDTEKKHPPAGFHRP